MIQQITALRRRIAFLRAPESILIQSPSEHPLTLYNHALSIKKHDFQEGERMNEKRVAKE